MTVALLLFVAGAVVGAAIGLWAAHHMGHCGRGGVTPEQLRRIEGLTEKFNAIDPATTTAGPKGKK